ncbi:MAG: class I SAM-dependent methyltransferase family protein [Candidatus Nezhaarchaeota archaeon]|nr:class I SAM-dependent methyltransferase family protein [Candidatus Nezhaarchaeota archaeon]
MSASESSTMEVERKAAKVPLEVGEEVRRSLSIKGLLDKELCVERSGNFLLLPLKPIVEAEAIKDELRVEVVKWRFKKTYRRPRNLVEALQDKLPPYKLACLPRSFDLIGDIALIELPPELEKEGELIAKGIMSVHPRVRAVYAKMEHTKGIFRVRPLKLLVGIDNPVTIHKENGCLFKVDLSSAYFSPRLSTERLRIVKQVNSLEVVADLFAGVGPYAIQIAKLRGAKVYAVDINPRAIELLRENIKANRVDDRVEVIHGDARRAAESLLKRRVDRVIMHHPSEAINFLEAGSVSLKSSGGVIHVYSFAGSTEEVEREVCERLSKYWKLVKVLHKRLVRQVSPRRWEAVVDVEVAKPIVEEIVI